MKVKNEDNLLKEAIADATVVKEMAIANAMLTLKEAFKPQLSSMLAARLRNEEEVIEQKKLDSSGIGTGVTVDEPAPKKPSAGASSSSDIENPGLETDTLGEGFDDEADIDIDLDSDGESDISVDAPGATAAPGSVAPAVGAVPTSPNPAQGGEEGGDGLESDDELDLEAIIRELEADLASDQTNLGAAQQGLSRESFNKVDDALDSQVGLQAETLEGDGDEGVHKDGKDIKAVDGVNGGKEVKAGQEVTEGESVEEEVDLEEILREMGADDDLDESSEQIASENVELKRSLREHREVIKLLRSRINEVNLLNSKLMYTTKIFRAFNLSEGQKKKVVEQFDRATTLRETKLVYSTLAESLTGKVGTATPKKIVAKITEGASKPINSTKPKSQTVLTEGGTQVARWQKIAGIVTNS